MSDVDKLEQEFLTARFAVDFKTRRPRYEIDPYYAHEVNKMLDQLSAARIAAAEAARPPTPVVNQADLDLLNRAMGINNGKTYFGNPEFMNKIETLRAGVMAGGSIPQEVRAATEADLAARGAK